MNTTELQSELEIMESINDIMGGLVVDIAEWLNQNEKSQNQ